MPNLDLAPVRAAIKAKIESVANVGTVHDYERYAREQSALAALYVNEAQSGKRLLGWFVSRSGLREVFVDTGRWVADAGWRIRGYMALDDADATEKTFSALIELIRDAFRNDDDVGGAVGTCIVEEGVAGVQVEDIDHVLFSGVLCHRARMTLTTRMFI